MRFEVELANKETTTKRGRTQRPNIPVSDERQLFAIGKRLISLCQSALSNDDIFSKALRMS